VSKSREVIFDEGSIHCISVSPSMGEHMELADIVEADVAIRHSGRHSIPSARLQDSHEFLNREKQAQDEGRAWVSEVDRELDQASCECLVAAVREDMGVPRTYKEAMKKPEAWRPSMDREMAKMWEHRVWTLVEAPADANIVNSKWHYTLKFNSNSDVVDHKLRLVAKGFTQVHGVNYFQTFASVVHFDSLCLLLVLAVYLDLELWQIDFESAFLNGRMKEDVYIRQLEGFIEAGKEHLVCKLQRLLYGMMQARHTWWHELDGTYSKLGYTHSKVDKSV
jgi:Reverse transcriptase (RNA-dependent DNA polymerase)